MRDVHYLWKKKNNFFCSPAFTKIKEKVYAPALLASMLFKYSKNNFGTGKPHVSFSQYQNKSATAQQVK